MVLHEIKEIREALEAFNTAVETGAVGRLGAQHAFESAFPRLHAV